jgi:hypothetical protein
MGDLPAPISRAVVTFELGADEVKEILAHEMSGPILIPVGTPDNDLDVLVKRFLDLISENPSIEVTYEVNSDQGTSYTSGARFRGYEFGPKHGDRYGILQRNLASGELENDPSNRETHGAAAQHFAIRLAEILRQRIYSFRAVRFGIADNPIGAGPTLAPDANNLVQVLDLLSRRNPHRWERYFESVRTVLPQIKAMTFVPSPRGGNTVRALLWNLDSRTERDDLALPLSESGTGVGQVLASSTSPSSPSTLEP